MAPVLVEKQQSDVSEVASLFVPLGIGQQLQLFSGPSNVPRFSCESQRKPVTATGGARLLQVLVSQLLA